MSDRASRRIPHRSAIDTLFLDVGNTLISMDFDWIAEVLAEGGLQVGPEAVRRAEAAARPETSRRLHAHSEREPTRLFRFRIALMLDELEARTEARADVGREALLDLLNERLRVQRGRRKLWSLVMPRVPESLERLRASGLRLVVVSNADGTIEEALEEADLRDYFDAIVDSHVVGFEKPDPRIFETALGRAGADPVRTLHVGDLYDADVTGARSAGLHALLLDPYRDWPELDCPVLEELAHLADLWCA
jgi:HAD superfamily hydrolase (TIGR01509 family)